MRIIRTALLSLIASNASAWAGKPAPSLQAQTLLLQAEGKSVHAACNGGDARVEGNHNVIVLTGPCAGLQINGVANQVTIDLRDNAGIRVEGSANRVLFRVPAGGAPNVMALGPNNSVLASSSAQAAPTPMPVSMPIPVPAAKDPIAKDPGAQVSATLDLVGDDEYRIADCTGRDVVVRGMRSAYVLNGGCRSVTVAGDLDIVQAEVSPGVRITIDGAGTLVSWAMKRPGETPLQRVRGRGSRVQRTDMIGGRPVR